MAHTATVVVLAALLPALSYILVSTTMLHMVFYDDVMGPVTLAAIVTALTMLCVAMLGVSHLAAAAILQLIHKAIERRSA